MIQPVDTILALVLLSVLISFGSSRLPTLIRVLAFQGVVVSIVPLFIGLGSDLADIQGKVVHSRQTPNG